MAEGHPQRALPDVAPAESSVDDPASSPGHRDSTSVSTATYGGGGPDRDAPIPAFTIPPSLEKMHFFSSGQLCPYSPESHPAASPPGTPPGMRMAPPPAGATPPAAAPLGPARCRPLCLSWLQDELRNHRRAAGDGLSHAVGFLDPRSDGGGWIRFGYDAAAQLRYSCNGAARPPFRQCVATICGTECYLSLPDIGRGVVLPFSESAAEETLPALRARFDEAGVAHNLPDDPDLQRWFRSPEFQHASLHAARPPPHSTETACGDACEIM
eukprot:TRINITY_DN2642_c0_g5_i1.p2 TRINITY_DN2642_c0_g5~~TRINITY_DN2642_c0_g5_i1.p2  ORF type:complete len:269 (+),score=61.19 TRINITY_DN2642_c0_g5_i1:59-865(+)